MEIGLAGVAELPTSRSMKLFVAKEEVEVATEGTRAQIVTHSIETLAVRKDQDLLQKAQVDHLRRFIEPRKTNELEIVDH